MSKPKPAPDDPAQSQRFIDMAREVQADEAAAAFEMAFAKIAVPSIKPSSTGVGRKHTRADENER